MASKFVSRWFYAELGKYEVDTGTFRTKIEERRSERYVDFDGFAKQLTKIYEELDSDGYEVINVVPISMGQSEHGGSAVFFRLFYYPWRSCNSQEARGINRGKSLF